MLTNKEYGRRGYHTDTGQRRRFPSDTNDVFQRLVKGIVACSSLPKGNRYWERGSMMSLLVRDNTLTGGSDSYFKTE